jgi:hypothetical protein
MTTIDARMQELVAKKFGGQDNGKDQDATSAVMDEGPSATYGPALAHEPALTAATDAMENPNPQLDSNHWMYPEDSRSITPPGGRSGEITAYGETFVEVPFFQRNRARFTKSASHVAWLGNSPLNADKVIHTDRWRVEAYPGPVTVGAHRPPGSVENSGELEWQTEVEGNWISQHPWDELTFTVRGALIQSRFSVTGTFQFGSTFFIVTGRDSVV